MDGRVNEVKQFMPFDSLSGFREALEKKEKKEEERKILTDSSIEILESEVKKLNIGSKAKITHYYNGQYVLTTGIITKIDYTKKQIVINNNIKINVINIVNITS